MHAICVVIFALAAGPTLKEIQVDRDMALDKNAQLNARLVIRADYVTIDGNGATLVGPGLPGKPASFKGLGVAAKGCKGVTLRNLKVKGFAAGLSVNGGDHWLVEDCDLSDNYHDPDAGWGNGPRRAASSLQTAVGPS